MLNPLGTVTPLGTIPTEGLGQFDLIGAAQAGQAAVSGVISSVRSVSGSLAASPSSSSGTAEGQGIQVYGDAVSGQASVSGELVGARRISGALSSVAAASGVASVVRVVSGAIAAGPPTLASNLRIDTTGVISLSITQTAFARNQVLALSIDQRIYSYGELIASVQSVITAYTSGVLTAGITQQQTATGTLSLSIRQSVVPPLAAVVPGSGLHWTAKVYIDSVDVSAALTRIVTIDAEVNAARVATFTLKPTAGPVNPFSWVNKPVRIDYLETNSAGAVLATYTLFNGVVDTPHYDVTTRLTTFDCTDAMQKRFEAMTKPVIAGIIPGYWSSAIFDEDADLWTYALDLLSTIPYDLTLSVSGNIMLTAWDAKATADYAFDESNILDGSLSNQLSNSRDLINDYEISFDYRYELYRERGVRYGWVMDPGLMSADFVVYSPDVPFGQAFIDAVESAGLVFTQAPYLTPLPVSGNYLVYGLSGGPQTLLWSNENPDGIMAAQATCSVRYSQTVTERRTSRVYSPQSVGQLGSITASMSGSVSSDYGEALAGFEETVAAEESHANNANALAYSSSGNPILYALGGEVTTAYQTYANDYSSYVYTGNYGAANEVVYDFSSLMVSGDRAEADNAAETMLRSAATEILATHRRNSVTFTTILAPYLDTIHTARVDTGALTAKGKIRQIVHSMDIDSGAALTECTLAISLASAVGIPDTPPTLTPPAAVDVAPVTSDSYDTVVSLPTYVAGLSGAFDENMAGWIAQSSVFAEGYSNQFIIPFGGVDEANVQEQEIVYEDEFEVIIPVDELLLEA